MQNGTEHFEAIKQILTNLGVQLKRCPFCGGLAALQTHVPPRGSIIPRMTLGCTKEPWANAGEIRFTTEDRFHSETYNAKFPHQSKLYTMEEAVIVLTTRWNNRTSCDITKADS